MRQLQYFVALAEHLSFSKAAEACYVTQSTLSAGIKELETQLGAQLVERTKRTVMLTALGHDVLTQAHNILNQGDALMQMVQGYGEPMSGDIRLGVIPTIAPFFLPDILVSLRENFPKLRLSIQEDLTARLIEKLHAGQLDVLLLAFPYDAPELEVHMLYGEAFSLIKPKTSDGVPDMISIADLKTEKLLLLEDGHCLRDHALAACELSTSAQQQEFSATSLQTLTQMVSHGYGMTLLPDMALRAGLVDENKVDIVRFSNPKPTRKIGLAWRKSSSRKDDFKTLYEHMKSQVLKNC